MDVEKLGLTNFRITGREFALAVVFAILGFVFSSRQFILNLNALNPLQGFLVYYAILFIAIYALSAIGLTTANITFKNLKLFQLVGVMLVLFSFFILVNWESPYVQVVSTGSLEGASNLFYASEDGVTFWFWHDIVNVQNIEFVRYLTFMVTPFVLSLLGLLFIEDKVKLGL